MSFLKELVEVGKEMGLEGNDLREFVEEREKERKAEEKKRKRKRQRGKQRKKRKS